MRGGRGIFWKATHKRQHDCFANIVNDDDQGKISQKDKINESEKSMRRREKEIVIFFRVIYESATCLVKASTPKTKTFRNMCKRTLMDGLGMKSDPTWILRHCGGTHSQLNRFKYPTKCEGKWNFKIEEMGSIIFVCLPEDSQGGPLIMQQRYKGECSTREFSAVPIFGKMNWSWWKPGWLCISLHIYGKGQKLDT